MGHSAMSIKDRIRKNIFATRPTMQSTFHSFGDMIVWEMQNSVSRLSLDNITECSTYNYTTWNYTVADGWYNYTVIEDFCYDYAPEYTFNCDASLPACSFANFSTFTPLPDEDKCS